MILTAGKRGTLLPAGWAVWLTGLAGGNSDVLVF